MHIPDGYLSPATCAVGYAAAAPFWYFSLKRVKRLLNTRLVPLIAVFSAFSFVVMMFNLPLPGGTTGHAVGIAIATIVLGPWAAILAVSVALLIQAVFFGDGGITAFGFNCFNMAVVGAFVTYAIYKPLTIGADLTAPRRVVAGAFAGYVAINAAAFCAAIEFGLQPLLFHAADGTPLYAPYPLSIAVPAMMIGHLTFAGLAELVITAGIVAYLQRANTELLAFTARGATAPAAEAVGAVARKGGWRATRSLWAGLAMLMILTPLGLIAAGTAWGEWGPDDFADPGARAAIEAASGGHAAPLKAPEGFARLSSVWTAPIPDYAPTFMKSETFGYIVSAVVGGGLIILVFLLIAWITRGTSGGETKTAPSG